MSFESALEILSYAEELERALRLRDVLVVAINAYLKKTGIPPRSHSERRRLLREIGREDLQALYSDLVKTLYEEVFYEGVYQPDEAKYAIEKIRKLVRELQQEVEDR